MIIFTDLYEFLRKLDQKMDNMRAKLDVVLINQSKIHRILLPEEKVLSKPSNMPALPLDTIEQVKMFEKFLSNDGNFSDTVSNVLYAFMVNIHFNKANSVSLDFGKILRHCQGQNHRGDTSIKLNICLFI